MRPSERRQIIAERLSAVGELDFVTLAQEFDVSEMTIRRDCEILEQTGLGRRIRGRITTLISRGYEPPRSYRESIEMDAKARIATAAVSLVSDGDTLILDVGTTNLEVARRLHGRRGLTVVTASLPIAIELSGKGGVHVIVTGGSLRPGELSVTGSFAEDMMRRFNCDLAFIGVGGVAAHAGFTDYYPEAAHIKAAAMASARKVVALADSTKVGRVVFSKFAELSEVDLLVTNAAPDTSAVRDLRAKGLEIQLID